MERVYVLCPSDRAEYLRMLEQVGPQLDDAGVSFHICRPGEDVPEMILRDKEVSK